MKQPDFTRKAIGLLLAPFALAALPAGAATLDVTNYDGWSDIYEGWDEANNRYFFNVSLESSECSLIGVETSETSITVPDAINIVVSHEDWNDETGEYNQWDETISMDVTKVYIHPDDYWMVNPLGSMSDFREWTLNDKIESFVYINWSGDLQNPQFHFTSVTAPSYIDLQIPDNGRYVVFAPEGAEAAYKDAFMGHSAMVVAEGTDPKVAFEQEIADTNAIAITDDNGESGINIVTWAGKDKDGNTFGFEEYDGITLRGIVTNAASIVVPENVCFANADIYALEVRPVTRFCLDYYNDEYTGFPGCDNLKDIYLPSGIVHAEFHPGEMPGKYNFHFTSEAVPESIYLDGGNAYWGVRPRYVISVPESAKEAYAAAFPEDACLVVAEGEDPKAVMENAIADLDALLITEGVEGVVNASWSGTDENGVTYAFDEPNYGAITFRGAITNEKSINIPEKVYVTNPDWYAFRVLEVASLDLCYHNDEETCFPNCSNLTDIYVPSSVTYALWNGGGFNGNYNFHFVSENVPDIRLYDNAGNNVNIYVPDTAFDNYAEALGDQDYILWSEAEATPVTVNVATPGTLAEEVSSLIENLNSVRWLVVTGTPNEIDLRMIRRLPRLEKLDLSGTTGLASVGGCNGLKYLREVILPEGITSIDNYAFNKCRSLSSINMPESLVEIGEYAFAESGIKSLDLSHVVKLDNFAFNNSRISNIDLSAAEVIGTDVFLNTPLGSVVFGENVRELGNSAFRSANLTGTLVIPSKVTRLNDWVFAYNPGITKIVIPKDVVYIDDDAFQGNRPEAVECNILYPYTQNGFYGTDMSNTILYVPSLTINDYLLSDYWVDFANVEPLPDDLKVLDLDRELTLKSDKGVAEKAELNMYRLDQDNYVGYGHLTVDRSTDLNLSAYSQAAIFAYDYWDSELGIWRYDNCYAGSTIIPESTVTADKVEVKMNLYRNRWYFLSFPFDVNVKDIVVDEDALWVVRKYDGAARANLEENTWQNMADETVLKAGEGYIFNCAVEDRNYVSFIFTPAADGNALFANSVVAKELKEYASDFAHNASWNLVGNTYPAYLNIKAVDFDAPITVWADNTYYAYSPVDDDYVLDPFQAFFVQRQGVEGGNAVKLNPAGRAHSREAAAELDLAQPQTRAAGVNLNRSLFNFYVNGESGMDRTRIVVNSEASFAYEANRDASKFMSTSELVPQIFVNNNNVRMAISESPLGNGQFTLGTRFGKAGSYTISLDSRNAAGYSVMLTDNVTGVTTDLTSGAYTFEADAATNDNRFTVTIGIVSGVDSAVVEGLDVKVEGNALNIVADEPVEIMVVAADGKVVASEKSAEFSVTLESGIYVVKVGNVTTKVNISK